MVRRLSGTWWAATALALTVAGCSAGPDAAQSPGSPTALTTPGVPSTSSSASPRATASSPPTSSTVSSPPVDVDAAYARVPAPARAHTPQGAQAFAEFYVDQINIAWTLPDPAMVAGYGLGTCRSCSAYESTARSLESDGQRYAGKPVSRNGGAWLPGATSSRVEVDVTGHQNSTRIVDSGGAVVDRPQEQPVNLRFDLRWSNASRWQVATIKVVKVA